MAPAVYGSISVMGDRTNSKQIAVIFGAGPAGLTAAFELATRTDIKPIILEMTADTGGISKTIRYRGNRIDIGGHRFFSKSSRVMDWWKERMPVQKEESDTAEEDLIMMIRRRISRIYFLRRFFDYPVRVNLNTISNLGVFRIVKIFFSYLRVKILPVRNIKNLEQFFISRFGRELYATFFRDYTKKVWGVACHDIRPEWGAQRIKGLSITKTILHAVRAMLGSQNDIEQRNVETSLIEKFLYPKYGPGQMWEEVAARIREKGGEVIYNRRVTDIQWRKEKIISVTAVDENGTETEYRGDFFFSSMPVRELITGMGGEVPEDVRRIAAGLVYRDFMTVGLLLKRLKIKNKTGITTPNNLVPDNWIYIQEKDVKIGRLQIFNNWSPYMVSDPDLVWIGLEYFCNEGDELWTQVDEEFSAFAIKELETIEIIDSADVLDSVVIRMPKAYPAYFGTYDEFDRIIEFTNQLENLFLIGRNGMHKYNNSDHSMLTAMIAVDNIIAGTSNRDNIWAVNTEEEYHEEQSDSVETPRSPAALRGD